MTASAPATTAVARWAADTPVRRLILFPHAGAGGLAGRAARSPGTEVLVHRRPGRESRMAEAGPFDVAAVVAEACEALLPVLAADDLPVAVLGHSFGALPAAEFAAAVQERLPGRIGALVLSARRAPPSPDPEIARLLDDDAALAAWVIGLGGTPEELLAEPVMREAILAPLRADLRASHLHGRPAPELSVPVLLMQPQDDPATPAGAMDGWAHRARGPVRRIAVPGGHHGLLSRPDELHAQLRAVLDSEGGRW